MRSQASELPKPMRVWSVVRITLLTLIALTVILPLLLLLSGSLMTAQEINSGAILVSVPQFHNFVTVFVDGDFGTYFINSLIYTAIIVPVSLFISSMAAFAFARITFRGRGVMFGAVLSVLMFPLEALFIPVFTVLVSFNLVDTRSGYILAMLTSTLPLSTFILHRFFNTIPIEIEESARVDGARIWTIFVRICLPLVRPGLAAAGILTFVSVWNEFLMAVIIFRTPGLMPVQRGLMQYASADRPQQQLMLAAAMLTLVPMIVVYAFAQRAIAQGVMEGSVRG